jgi:hypothetical protein
MKAWGFCGPTYMSQSPNIDDEDAMNCYCEQSESPAAKTAIALLHTPGKKVFASMAGEASIPGLFTVNGRTFAAASKLYELTGAGPVVRGVLAGSPVAPPMMTANETQLVILANGNLFVMTYKGAITAAAIITVGVISVATVTAGHAGTGYAINDTGTIAGGAGGVYTVTAITGAGPTGPVETVAISPGSTGYSTTPNLATTVTTGSGDGALELNITAGYAGQNYAPGDQGTVDGSVSGSGATYTVTAIGPGGSVVGFKLTPGSGYVVENNNPTAITSGNGDGTLQFNITAVQDNNFYPVDMTQFNGLIAQIGFVDGYVIATLQNSHTFQQSNLEDATVWNGLNISTISYFPDNITSMICDHRTIVFFSAKKAVVYYNSGAGFPVFIPIQGAFIETGSGAAFATVQIDPSVFWLSQDDRGALIANRSQGYNAQRISTHATELAWQQYGVTSDAVGWSYQEYGHSFWVLNFPSANGGAGATWAYDLSTGYWGKRGFYNSVTGTYTADRAMCHTFNFEKHLVGDWATGTVYELSSLFYDDFGNAIRGYRRSPTISDENKWIYFKQIELDVEVGLGAQPPLLDGDGQPRPPQVMLRWSNDGGKTWSNTYTLSVGAQGGYDTRVIMRMLGRARKRVWEVSWSDACPWRFADAYLEAEPQMA